MPEQEEVELTEGKDKQGKGFRATLEQWQHTIDERIRAVLPNFSAFRELQTEVQRISSRLDEIEKKLGITSAPKE